MSPYSHICTVCTSLLSTLNVVRGYGQNFTWTLPIDAGGSPLGLALGLTSLFLACVAVSAVTVALLFHRRRKKRASLEGGLKQQQQVPLIPRGKPKVGNLGIYMGTVSMSAPPPKKNWQDLAWVSHF